MKTTTISTPTHEIMLMELPSADSDYYIAYENIRPETYISTKPLYGNPKARNLYAGIWEPLGKIPYLHEKRIEPLVDSWESVSKDGTKIYENYKSGVPKCKTALESFLSLLETEIYWENPYQDDWDELCTWGHGGFAKDGKSEYKLYHEAQSRTFDKERTIVLVKER